MDTADPLHGEIIVPPRGGAGQKEDEDGERRNPKIMVFQTISYPSVSSTARKNATSKSSYVGGRKIGQSGDCRMDGSAVKISVVYHNLIS